MNEKFKNKYRIPSTRLQHWDYSSNGYYFLTICTKNREHYFGEIIVETPKLGVSTTKMQLSETGQTVKKYWLEIPDHFPFVVLDEFVIMPNHIHGIMGFNNNLKNNVETPKLGVSTWKNGCLGVIINQYKRICTINIKKKNNLFAWQSRFYDHIIRDEKSLNRIREYIRNNPTNWKNDRNNLDNAGV